MRFAPNAGFCAEPLSCALGRARTRFVLRPARSQTTRLPVASALQSVDWRARLPSFLVGARPPKSKRKGSQREEGTVASEDVAREGSRAAFFARPGVRLVIEAGAHPLGLQGFDPLNVESLGGVEVLHKRLLQLSNERGTIEVLNRDALTEGAGRHPLFEGVRVLTLTGLSAEPKGTRDGETVKIEAEGFTATLKGVLVQTSGSLVRITWPPDLPPPSSGAAPPTALRPHSSTD